MPFSSDKSRKKFYATNAWHNSEKLKEDIRKENSTARNIMTGIPITSKDHNIVDHLGLPKADYEARYGKLPSNWNSMTHGQKMNVIDKLNDAKSKGYKRKRSRIHDMGY